MSSIIQIQPLIFCEPCKDCGSRPVIQQVKNKYIVRCPKDKKHYSTAPGLIDIDDWNRENKAPKPLVKDSPAQKAS